MSKGKLIGIIVGVVCIIVVIVVVTRGGLPPEGGPGGGPDGGTPHGDSEGRIAFKQTDGIHVINPDGTGEITLGEGNWPVWSPDGNKIAYGVGGELRVANADGTGKTTVRSFEDGSAVPHSWLSDGRIVLYVGPANEWSRAYGRGSVYTMNSNGSDLVKLGDMPQDGLCFALSLDGERVVYMTEKSNEGNGYYYYYVWVMNTDGSDKRRLVEEDLYTNRWGASLCENFGPGFSWSPDGNKVTVLHYTSVEGSRLWLMDSDGTDRVLLSGWASAGGWSRDSRKVVIDDETGLFVISVDNMSRTKVSGPNDGRPASWAPDGERIVFSSYEGSITVANTDGSGSSVIGYGYWPEWSPG